MESMKVNVPRKSISFMARGKLTESPENNTILTTAYFQF